MRVLLTIAICLITLQITANPIGAVVYKWKDKNGVVHFSNKPPASVQEMEILPNTTNTAPAPQEVEVRDVTQRSGSKLADNEVEIFTTSGCGYCKKAVAFLKANHIPFILHDIEKDPGAKKRMRALGGRGDVPFAIINDQEINGFSEDTYKRVLGLSK
jgi:glutaredoxin